MYNNNYMYTHIRTPHTNTDTHTYIINIYYIEKFNTYSSIHIYSGPSLREYTRICKHFLMAQIFLLIPAIVK